VKITAVLKPLSELRDGEVFSIPRDRTNVFAMKISDGTHRMLLVFGIIGEPSEEVAPHICDADEFGLNPKVYPLPTAFLEVATDEATSLPLTSGKRGAGVLHIGSDGGTWMKLPGRSGFTSVDLKSYSIRGEALDAAVFDSWRLKWLPPGAAEPVTLIKWSAQ
jgi:hypothetical protein